MLNSDDLRFFYTIATHPTLAAAARYLGVTPPSVTQRLQGIEQRLGVRLIQRPSRFITLTDEGCLVKTRAERIIEELAELQEIIRNRRHEVSGKLSVLAPLGFGTDYVAPLLGEYSARYPHLEVELTLSDDPSWSSFHQWDVVIYIGELRDSSMHCTPLVTNRRYVCASPAYLEQKGIPDSPSALRLHDCIALRENSEDVTLWRFNRGNEEYPIRIHPRLASNEGRVVTDWALAGRGIIVRSEWDVMPHLNRGKLVRVLQEFNLPDAPVVALTGSDAAGRSPRTHQFIRFLKEFLSSRPWDCET